jgi:steroid delta-isomerase-like uncharacterized protein
MSTEQNKAIMEKYMQAINDHTVPDIMDEIIADDFMDRSAPPGMPNGREGFVAAHTILETAFPDVSFTTETAVAQDDKVLIVATGKGTHTGDFFGIPATNKVVTWWGVRMMRIADGKIKESWAVFDQVAILQQLGVIPSF